MFSGVCRARRRGYNLLCLEIELHRELKLSLVLLLAALLPVVAGATAGEAAAESASPAPAPKVAAGAADGPVFVLKLTDEDRDGAISRWNLTYLKRCLERAEKAGAVLFVLEIDTYGGSVMIVERMGKALSSAKGLRTVAFVRERAMSAGAFLAYSCNEIYMESGSRIGAATPWVPGAQGAPQNLPSKVEEKNIRYVTKTFRAMAEKNGHNGALAAGMVDPDLEILAVRVENQTVPMTRDEYESALRDNRDRRKLSAEQVIVKKGKILVFDARDAVRWKLAGPGPKYAESRKQGAGTVAGFESREELLSSLGLARNRLVELEPNWGEHLAWFCSSGWIVSLLITIAILALYSEMHKPTGMGAAVFVIALATFFWAQFLAGTAGPVSIILFLLGLALLLAEIFFIPGFGFAGIGGIVLMLVGMISARIPADFFSPPEGFELPGVQMTGVLQAVTPVFIAMGASVLGIAVIMRFFPQLPIFRRLVLKSDLGSAVVTAAQAAGVETTADLVGMTGVAATKLRPGGSARFGDRLLDVVSDGEFLEAGAAVKIVSASGNRVVVRRN